MHKGRREGRPERSSGDAASMRNVRMSKICPVITSELQKQTEARILSFYVFKVVWKNNKDLKLFRFERFAFLSFGDLCTISIILLTDKPTNAHKLKIFPHLGGNETPASE